MISSSNGEVLFVDLRILPHSVLTPGDPQRIRKLPVPGWSQHLLGVRRSDRGTFEVEAVSDEQRHIQVVLLAHQHPFYEKNTPEDGERRAFHEGIINADLAGQREFSWGQVFCRFDSKSNKDWLVLAYTPGPHVPKQTSIVLERLHARDPEPSAS
jgi:hypothetical protein